MVLSEALTAALVTAGLTGYGAIHGTFTYRDEQRYLSGEESKRDKALEYFLIPAGIIGGGVTGLEFVSGTQLLPALLDGSVFFGLALGVGYLGRLFGRKWARSDRAEELEPDKY